MGKCYWAGKNVTENQVKLIDIITITYSFEIQLTYK